MLVVIFVQTTNTMVETTFCRSWSSRYIGFLLRSKNGVSVVLFFTCHPSWVRFGERQLEHPLHSKISARHSKGTTWLFVFPGWASWRSWHVSSSAWGKDSLCLHTCHWRDTNAWTTGIFWVCEVDSWLASTKHLARRFGIIWKPCQYCRIR